MKRRRVCSPTQMDFFSKLLGSPWPAGDRFGSARSSEKVERSKLRIVDNSEGFDPNVSKNWCCRPIIANVTGEDGTVRPASIRTIVEGKTFIKDSDGNLTPVDET